MTAFHITIIVIILFLVTFFILIHKEGLPYGYEEWIAAIGLSLMIELIVIMIGIKKLLHILEILQILKRKKKKIKLKKFPV